MLGYGISIDDLSQEAAQLGDDKMRHRVVLDTNVLVAAAYASASASRAIVEACLHGELEATIGSTRLRRHSPISCVDIPNVNSPTVSMSEFDTCGG